MISDLWREHLYFLGFLSSFAFGGRFLLQWITSEYRKESVVPPAFWILSLLGNLLLLFHSFIQIQFHVFLIQTCNAVISWRNLNLMQPPARHFSFKSTVIFLFGAVAAASCCFLLQSFFLSEGSEALFRIPITPWHRNIEEQIPPLWHVLGFGGLLLFNSRFWVQWWFSEKRDASYLGASFWWLSLIGDTFCLMYFARLGDPVNLIGPLIGLIPYIRNLMLLNKIPKTMTSKNTL